LPGLAGSSRLVVAPLVRAALLTLMLGGAIGARWAATVGALADGIVIGAAFGGLLVVGAALVGWRPGAISGRRLAADGAIGLGAAAALVAVALAVRWPGPWLPFDPAGSFLPWAAVTVLVATAEELVLRGALFDALDDATGSTAALLATTVLFALLHVPLYGWRVVPLDLGVGLFLGGLRLLTGGTVAPAVAHVVADLATWWI
jgi:membrane protease YdiL (CAAX protease family)